MVHQCHHGSFVPKGRTIGKLMGRVGGGAAGEVQKKYLRTEKLDEKKIHARQLALKNIHAMAYKKIHTRNLITTKKFPTLPPITFLMVRP